MSEDKTRMEPREVLTMLAAAFRDDGHVYAAEDTERFRDKHCPPPAPAVVIPEEAVRAYARANPSAGVSHAGLMAAAPLILAANQKNPKAVGWVVVDKSGMMRSQAAWNADAERSRQSQDRIFPDRAPHRVLALVEPSEVER